LTFAKANFRKNLCAKSPEVASVYLRRIYRALFTRPMRAARAFSVDPETRDFLRGQLDGRASAEHEPSSGTP
jgi:hypothetical protein